jgi:hypothetical protein
MGIFSLTKAVQQPVLRAPGGLPETIDRRQPFGTTYSLDTSTVDVALARALYQNTDPRYKLGAGFAKPSINVPVGFMGVPMFNAQGAGDAQRLLQEHAPTWSGDILSAHVALFRDGEILLRPRPANRSPAYAALFEGEDFIEFSYNPAGTFDLEHLDEDMGAVTGVKVEHKVIVKDAGRYIEKSLFEIIYPDRIIHQWENDYRPKKEFGNPLGFVPAIHMQNAPEVGQLHASSELEPAEPYFRFYNDVMLHAGTASQLHSTAKLTIRVRDIATFLQNNFTDTEITERTLRFKNKDVLFFETGVPDLQGGGTAYQEGADVVQAEAPLGDTTTLLEYIFLNIVDVTEVPEWAYGGAIASSKASVVEQSAPLIHKVSRKRTMVENRWALGGRMALAMLGTKAKVTATWDDLQQRDTKAEAEALSLVTDAMVALTDAEIVSVYSAVEQLRPFMPAVLEYIVEKGDETRDTELERIEAEQETQDESQLDLMQRLLAAQNGSDSGELDEQDRQAGIAAVR